MEDQLNARVIIRGRVQGVFFRMETKRTADKSGVCGWVKNLNDGTVEALFEGERADVEAVLNWCKKGPPLSSVAGVDIEWGPFSGRFKRFEVTY